MDFFNKCNNLFHLHESCIESVAKNNHNLYFPTSRPNVRDEIYIGIDSVDTIEYFNTRLYYPIPIKRRILNILPRWIKEFIISIK